MLAVLSMLVIVSAFTYGALNFTANLSRNVMGSNTLRTATEVGDGALDFMFANWREIMKENPPSVPAPTSSAFGSIPLPTAAMFPSISNFTVSRNLNPTAKTATKFTIANYCVQAMDPQMNYLVAQPTPLPTTSVAQTCLGDGTAVPIGYGMSQDQNSVYYLASADVTLPAFGGRNVTVQVRRVFQRQISSPWEYALFYNDLLEINPGAAMNINGWVHTNGNLYTAGDGSGGQQLTFQSKADYAGDWAYNPITYAPGDSDHTTVTSTLPAYPTGLPPARGETQLPFGMDPTQIFTNTNSNNTGYIELIQPPVTGQPDPIASSRYYDQADIHISVNGSGTVTMTDSGGNVINSSATAGTLDYALYKTFSSAVSVQTNAFADNREAAVMNIVNVDLSKLTSALTATSAGGTGYLLNTTNPNNFQKGAVVYVYDTAGSATTKWGVRLKNGATLKAGLTVASQNPVYIQGDFNTGQTSGNKTPANTANNSTGNNVVSGYTEQSCAILADAVNVLSNAWTDSTNISTPPNATSTTINAAIVSGIVPTSSSYSGATSYSGGAENFPRLLENWSGQTFTYYGSMVELYQSQQSTGRWGKNNVYSAANRNWHFDTLFYTQPPPGSLQIVTYAKQRWYVQ